MSIQKTTVSQLQKAGQAIHDAAQSLSRDAQRAGEILSKHTSAATYVPDADRLYEQWKSVARMSQKLVEMEVALRSVYEECVDIATLPVAKKESRGKSLEKATRKESPHKVEGKRKPGRPPKTAVPPGAVGTPREGNEQRLMDYFNKTLSHTELQALHHHEITAATGIPAGSIAATIKRLVGKNLLVTGRRGALRLSFAQPNAIPAVPTPGENSAATPH